MAEKNLVNDSEGKRHWTEESCRLMVESVSDYAIVMLDSVGYVMSWNKGAECIQGYHAQEIIGQHFSLFYSPDDIASGKPLHDLDEASTKGRFADDAERMHKDGSLFWAHVTCTAIWDQSKTLLGFAHVMHNMTIVTRTEKELAKAVNAFVFIASHDLQEPLRTLRNYVTLLQEDILECLPSEQTLSVDVEEDIYFIREAAKRMSSLVHSMLENMRAGYQPLKLKVLDLNHCLATVLVDLAAIKAEKQADIRCEGLPIVEVDVDQINRILQNLISNAIKFCQHQPVITISASENAREWTIAVTDNGIGIAPENLGKIFLPFQRLHHHTAYLGNGIGLAITKEAVERHGGRLSVSSQIGAGSVFKFTIPKLTIPKLTISKQGE